MVVERDTQTHVIQYVNAFLPPQCCETLCATQSALLLVGVINILQLVRRKQYVRVQPAYSSGSVRTPQKKLESCELHTDAVHSHVTLHAREKSSLAYY